MSSGDSLFSLGHLEDRRLREESLKAFAKAMHTDRMVAVTGSLSTFSLGYPSGGEFVQVYGAVAYELADRLFKNRAAANPAFAGTVAAQILKGLRARGRELADGNLKHMDVRVGMWSVYDAFRALDALMSQNRVGLVMNRGYQTPSLTEFESGLARVFRARSLGVHPFPQHAGAASIAPMIASLGIKRIATLNYDLELERAFMLREDERQTLKNEQEDAVKGTSTFPTRQAGFIARSEDTTQRLSVERFIGAAGSGKPILKGARGHLSRTMGNGVTVESDVVDRERPDRLFEFATGSAETDRHILHLHGRADEPGSLVANIRQYDRLYRLDDQYRDPFDHGLRVLFGGNPILFVGIGMNEDEINRTLQYFVSNAPLRRPSPMFLVWNTADMGSDCETEMRNRRLDFRTRLGVQILFDRDLKSIPKDDSGDPFAKLAEISAGMREAIEAKTLTPLREVLDVLSPPKITELDRARSLATLLGDLPTVVARVDRRLHREDCWRSPERRWDAMQRDGTDTGVRLWGGIELIDMVRSGAPIRIERDGLASNNGQPSKAPNLIAIAAPTGIGRGAWGERLIQMESQEIVIGNYLLSATRKSNRLLINAGFSYDSDAMLTGIATFLDRRREQPFGDSLCRERSFADGSLFDTSEHVLVVINGADRFFSFDGTPLSAELDHMLRSAMKHDRTSRVQIVLLGTDRLNRYCGVIGAEPQALEEKLAPKRSGAGGSSHSPMAGEGDMAGPPLPVPTTRFECLWERGSHPESVYHRWIADCFKRRRGNLPDPSPRTWDASDITPAAAVNIDRALNFNREGFNRAFFDAYLSPALLQALGIECPQTFEVLRTMCFIGSPTEGFVLLCAPKVWAILAEGSSGTDALNVAEVRIRLARTLQGLLDLGLIIRLEDYSGSNDAAPGSEELGASSDGLSPRTILQSRYGLHRSLASYLRDRHGAPINDAKLSTTFNMSLFMSEPGDNYTPEPGFHDELGHLVDSLIGAWHDVARLTDQSFDTFSQDDFDCPLLDDLYVHFDDREHALLTVGRRASWAASACLRASLSLVRGYYSTGALLKFDRDERLATMGRDGALTEHAHRLDRLIGAFGDIATARKIVRQRADHTGMDAWSHLGPEPFYADDLVWLLNERGVVALTQGQLFDARDAFRAADTVNKTHVERNYRGHNWRRIALNLVATRIERSALRSAERLLDEIESTINGCRRHEAREDERDRITLIRSLTSAEEGPMRGTADYSREEVCVVAMATGYRGLIAHLRGQYHEAASHYRTATEVLRRLGEHRAFAHFQRHYATLHMFVGNRGTALQEVEFSIITAQSAAQMDILHRARVVRANIRRGEVVDQAERRHNLQDIKDALRYAALADCYRVRIEASASLARHMRHGGDYDTALRYAVDALTIASRYGHSLQKTSLRIEIGQILAARGDARSGKALLDKAAVIGAAKGHHHANERVQRARTAIATYGSTSNRADIPISPG